MNNTIEPVLLNQIRNNDTIHSKNNVETKDANIESCCNIIYKLKATNDQKELFPQINNNLAKLLTDRIDTLRLEELKSHHTQHSGGGGDSADNTSSKNEVPINDDTNFLRHTYSGDYCSETYDMDDLQFNLDPNRSLTYGNNIRDAFNFFSDFQISKNKIEQLFQIIDKTCSNDMSCLYNNFFPIVGDRPGPVCFPQCMEKLITETPLMLTSQGSFQLWNNILMEIFLPPSDGGMNMRPKELEVCICCLLVKQSKTEIDAYSRLSSVDMGPSHEYCSKKTIKLLGWNDQKCEKDRQGFNYFQDNININGHWMKQIISLPFNQYKLTACPFQKCFNVSTEAKFLKT